MVFSFITSSYEALWKQIIQPPRQEYTRYDLGSAEFNLKDIRIIRTDITLPTKRGINLACSFFRHANTSTILPCIIYLHGNGCSRIEARQHMEPILLNGYNLFCFDFAACGQSEGEYSTLGLNEQDDLDEVIQYLYKTNQADRIALWGRSMGAVTALLYSIKSHKPECLILDSPFADFKRLFEEQVKQKTSMPGFLGAGAYSILRMTIKKKAQFDVDVLKPIDQIKELNIPTLFGASKDDVLISPNHSQDLHRKCGGPKNIVIFTGEHNGKRPPVWIFETVGFLKTHFPLEKKLKILDFSDHNTNHDCPTEESVHTGTHKINELDASPLRLRQYKNRCTSDFSSRVASLNAKESSSADISDAENIENSEDPGNENIIPPKSLTSKFFYASPVFPQRRASESKEASRNYLSPATLKLGTQTQPTITPFSPSDNIHKEAQRANKNHDIKHSQTCAVPISVDPKESAKLTTKGGPKSHHHRYRSFGSKDFNGQFSARPQQENRKEQTLGDYIQAKGYPVVRTETFSNLGQRQASVRISLNSKTNSGKSFHKLIKNSKGNQIISQSVEFNASFKKISQKQYPTTRSIEQSNNHNKTVFLKTDGMV